MKKKIMISSFLALVLATAIIFIIAAMNTYNYEVANDDIMAGFGTAMILAVGGFAVFYELDLFYTVYYFIVKPKTKAKSILNVVSNLTLICIIFTDVIAHFLYEYVSEIFGEEVILLVALIFVYVILRIVCAAISAKQFVGEE